jgi:hypothetical protein
VRLCDLGREETEIEGIQHEKVGETDVECRLDGPGWGRELRWRRRVTDRKSIHVSQERAP